MTDELPPAERAVTDPEDAAEHIASTFSATLVDEWVRLGVTRAVIAPGSRSTPLAVALAGNERMAVQVHHDERSAAFVGLGLSIATGVPTIVLTTSGTAAVEMHPAVVEAHHAGVPLLAVTADRPPELVGVGAPQTIDQTDLYGSAVRWFCDPGVPEASQRASWRRIAGDAARATVGPVPGPVHLNLPFREPLLGPIGQLPPVDDDSSALVASGPPDLEDEQIVRWASAWSGRRGVIVAGGGAARSAVEADAILDLARALGWPVIADHLSGCRLDRPETAWPTDAMLRLPAIAEELRPEIVLRFGRSLASRVTNEWLAASAAVQIGVDPHGQSPDPDAVLSERVHATPAVVARALTPLSTPADRAWTTRWRELAGLAAAAIESAIATSGGVTEPGAARAALWGVPIGGALVVSSSMPVRDVEWTTPPRAGVAVVANRGANGIDGVVSTAVGVALAGAPVVCLIGDVAFLHDTNGLLGLARRGVDLAFVVVDNDGGGIFSFLPQATQLPESLFETIFGTPHGVDLEALARAHGLWSTSVGTQAGLEAALVGWRERQGVSVIVVRSDRQANVEVHRRIQAAVADSVG